VPTAIANGAIERGASLDPAVNVRVSYSVRNAREKVLRKS
jgi:hypothetical protein